MTFFANSDPAALITLILFVFAAITAGAIAVLNHLLTIIILAGVFSLLAALLFFALDAVDVAFTEAAVGAGLATILMLATASALPKTEKPAPRRILAPLFVTSATAILFINATLDLHIFGHAETPAQKYTGNWYLAHTAHDMGIPNVVTAILAGYRAYDTLGELVVIFTAGIATLAILAAGTKNK